MQVNQIVAISLAIISFCIILFVGLKTDLLQVAKSNPVGDNAQTSDEEKPYSFHKTQLWLWTLAIAPCLSLNWGFGKVGQPNLNATALILLGISGATALTAEVIAGTQVNSARPGSRPLKALNVSSSSFWSDILKDDAGQLSILRLQQLIFTLSYIGIYISMFFPEMEFPTFKDNVFVLMGISTGSYLVGKGLNK